jgi:hypothetical protein
MISALLAPLYKYISGGLLFVSLILGIALAVERVHARHLSTRVTELTELRASDQARFEAAQQQAEAQAQANVSRVKSEQQRITSDVQSDYARQLADIRARFDRLRAPKANPGQPQGSAVPPGGPAPNGADDPTGERLSPSERQLAAEISLRLRALQDWVTRQSQVHN